MFLSRKKRAAAKAQRLADESNFGLNTPRMETCEGAASPCYLDFECNTANKQKEYTPKQRKKTKNKKLTGDNDIWIEQLAVVEIIYEDSGEISNVIRSYFSSQATGAREWDEPPSGASNVQYATEQMHEMAKAQLKSIIEDIDAIKAERQSIPTENMEHPLPLSPKKKKGLTFLRRSSSTTGVNKDTVPDLTSSQNRINRSEVFSRQIQKALEISLKDQPRSASEFKNGEDLAILQGLDDEEIAIAMALSLSENQQESSLRIHGEESNKSMEFAEKPKLNMTAAISEAQMLALAIEASKCEMEIGQARCHLNKSSVLDFFEIDSLAQSENQQEKSLGLQREESNKSMEFAEGPQLTMTATISEEQMLALAIEASKCEMEKEAARFQRNNSLLWDLVEKIDDLAQSENEQENALGLQGEESNKSMEFAENTELSMIAAESKEQMLALAIDASKCEIEIGAARFQREESCVSDLVEIDSLTQSENQHHSLGFQGVESNESMELDDKPELIMIATENNQQIHALAIDSSKCEIEIAEARPQRKESSVLDFFEVDNLAQSENEQENSLGLQGEESNKSMEFAEKLQLSVTAAESKEQMLALDASKCEMEIGEARFQREKPCVLDLVKIIDDLAQSENEQENSLGLQGEEFAENTELSMIAAESKEKILALAIEASTCEMEIGAARFQREESCVLDLVEIDNLAQSENQQDSLGLQEGSNKSMELDENPKLTHAESEEEKRARAIETSKCEIKKEEARCRRNESTGSFLDLVEKIDDLAKSERQHESSFGLQGEESNKSMEFAENQELDVAAAKRDEEILARAIKCEIEEEEAIFEKKESLALGLVEKKDNLSFPQNQHRLNHGGIRPSRSADEAKDCSRLVRISIVGGRRRSIGWQVPTRKALSVTASYGPRKSESPALA